MVGEEGRAMFDWNNPVGLGLFLLEATGSLVLIALTAWLTSRTGKSRR